MVHIMTSTFLLGGLGGISNNFSGVDLFVVSTYFFTFKLFLTVLTNYPRIINIFHQLPFIINYVDCHIYTDVAFAIMFMWT